MNNVVLPSAKNSSPFYKRSLFAAVRPNFNDFSPPPNGDYVRYVEGLIAWAEQEQARQRFKDTDDKAQAALGVEWGRRATLPSTAPNPAVHPDGVVASLQSLAHQAQAPIEAMQHQALRDSTAGLHQSASFNTKSKQHQKTHALAVLALGALAAGLIFFGMPQMLPLVIIVWVAYNVIRSVRAASLPRKP